MKDYIKLLRVKHYIKNLLIFLPLIFNGSIFDIYLLVKSVIGFITFSLISSVVYIINDINDVERDRTHPSKRKRPLASGRISQKNAYRLLICCLTIAVTFSCMNESLPGIICLALYLCLNLLYSFGMKNKPIIDVVILVSGFFIRVLYGALITDIQISNWLFLTIIAIAFYLALGKRRNEMKLSIEGVRF